MMNQNTAITREARVAPRLDDEQIACLRELGTERDLAPGETLFVEGQIEDDFWVVLDGGLKITRHVGGTENGDEIVLGIHEPGEFTGALSLFTGEPSIANAYALGPTRVLRVDLAAFQKLIQVCPPVAGFILSTMAVRRPDADALVLQREKLAALGKMSAGLAHELNNPAAAARRANGGLRERLAGLHERTRALCAALNADAWNALAQSVRDAGERARTMPPLDPLAESDREDAVCQWLDEHGIFGGWKMAAILAPCGPDAAWLDDLAAVVPANALEGALRWAEAQIGADALLNEAEQSTARISELVAAIKSYSHLDQTPLGDTDLTTGLENTLTILGHKLRKKGVSVARHYAPDLPRVRAYPGELNQAWTNLLDNAADAVPGDGCGQISLRTVRENDHVLVVIEDNGPGIAPEHQARIWEPFFTTKPVGEGTGLGLDTTFRIVTQRHRGDVRVVSPAGPGNQGTRFEVRLPLGGPA